MANVKRIVVTPELFDQAPRLSCGDRFAGELRRCDGWDVLAGVKCTTRTAFKFVFTAQPGTRYVIDFSSHNDWHLGARIVVKDRATGRVIERVNYGADVGMEIVPTGPTTYEVTVGPVTDGMNVDGEWKSMNFQEFQGGLSCRPRKDMTP